MNTEMMASATGHFELSSRPRRFQFVITALTAVDSLAVGAFVPGGKLWPVGGSKQHQLSPGH